MPERSTWIEVAFGAAWSVLMWGAGALIVHLCFAYVDGVAGAAGWAAPTWTTAQEFAAQVILWTIVVGIGAIFGSASGAVCAILGTGWLVWLFWPWLGHGLHPMALIIPPMVLGLTALVGDVRARRHRYGHRARRQVGQALVAVALLAMPAGLIGWFYWGHHTGLLWYYQDREEFDRAFSAAGIPPEVTRAQWRAMWAGIAMPEPDGSVTTGALEVTLGTGDGWRGAQDLDEEDAVYPVYGYRSPPYLLPPGAPRTYLVGHTLIYYFTSGDRIVAVYLAPS